MMSSMASRGSESAGGNGVDADRPAAVILCDHAQIAPVHGVEAGGIHFQFAKRSVGDLAVDRFVAVDVGEVAHAAQQPSGDARGAARAARDLVGAVRRHADAEDAGATIDDLLELFHRIEIQPHRNAEAVAQRIGEQAGARGGADQREGREVDLHRARRRPLADDQIELEILHRRIEDFLHRRIEPVDFVDEQHVARFEIGQQRGKIAGLGDHRTGGGAEVHAQFARHDLRQRGLAQPRRADEQHVVERFLARPRGLDEYAQDWRAPFPGR